MLTGDDDGQAWVLTADSEEQTKWSYSATVVRINIGCYVFKWSFVRCRNKNKSVCSNQNSFFLNVDEYYCEKVLTCVFV